jgi:predicted nucleic acid-binding protein
MVELEQGVKAGYVPACDWKWLDVLTPDTRVTSLADDFRSVVDAGEAESLAAALVRGCVFVSDDLAARRLAKHHGVKVSGTLGILIRLVKSEMLSLDEANMLLQTMIAYGYRSPVSSLTSFI